MIHMLALFNAILDVLHSLGAHHPSFINVGDYAKITTHHWTIIIRKR